MDLSSNLTLGEPNQLFRDAFRNIDEEMQMCIQNCTMCHQICMQVMAHCLEKGGAHASPEHIRLLHDCAEICDVSANFMMRNSDLHSITCGACAEICLACAKSCEQIGEGEEWMKACIAICKQCAESCEKMAMKH